MSIEDPGVTTARATAGGAWAEGSNTFDEGPFGHTYLQPMPASGQAVLERTTRTMSNSRIAPMIDPTMPPA